MAGPFKMKGYSPFHQNIQKDINKYNRLSGGQVTFEEAWDAMTRYERAQHGDDITRFITEAKKFTEQNPDYAHGTEKYRKWDDKPKVYNMRKIYQAKRMSR
jgi:hypothetical protein